MGIIAIMVSLLRNQDTQLIQGYLIPSSFTIMAESQTVLQHLTLPRVNYMLHSVK